MFNSPRNKNSETAATQEKQQAQTIGGFNNIEKFLTDLEDSYVNRKWLYPFRWPALHEEQALVDGRMPNIDLIDNKSTILVKAELPGIEQKDIDITLSDRVLTIEARRTQDVTEDKTNYYRREIHKGSYTRTITLPCTVDSDKTKAQFKDGVLEIVLTKTDENTHKRVVIS